MKKAKRPQQTKAELAAQAKRRHERALIEISSGAAQLSTEARSLYLGRSRRACDYLAKSDATFPRSVNTDGRPQYRRADLDAWVAARPTAERAEPTQLAASHGQVHRIAEPRARRAASKPPAARKATRQTVRPGV